MASAYPRSTGSNKPMVVQKNKLPSITLSNLIPSESWPGVNIYHASERGTCQIDTNRREVQSPPVVLSARSG